MPRGGGSGTTAVDEDLAAGELDDDGESAATAGEEPAGEEADGVEWAAATDEDRTTAELGVVAAAVVYPTAAGVAADPGAVARGAANGVVPAIAAAGVGTSSGRSRGAYAGGRGDAAADDGVSAVSS